MRLFITGSSGFIGSNLAKYYKAHDLYLYKRNENLLSAMKGFNPDVIINCAAEIYDTNKMWESNYCLTDKCLYYAKNYNCKMIQLGSSSEYGTSDEPTDETHPLNGSDPYSITKKEASRLCIEYGKNLNTEICIVRPYSPYGPGEKQHRLFPKLWKSFKLNEEINLTMGSHDFCYIDDFIEGINCLIENTFEFGEAYNISSGIEHSNVEVLEIFRKLTGKLGNVRLVNKMTTPKHWISNCNKMKKTFNWEPYYTLEMGIEKFLKVADYE